MCATLLNSVYARFRSCMGLEAWREWSVSRLRAVGDDGGDCKIHRASSSSSSGDDDEDILYIRRKAKERMERYKLAVCALRIVCTHFFEPFEIKRQEAFALGIKRDWRASYDAVVEIADIEYAKFTGVIYCAKWWPS